MATSDSEEPGPTAAFANALVGPSGLGAAAVVDTLPIRFRAFAEAEAPPPDPATNAEPSAWTCPVPAELAAASAEADPNPPPGPYPVRPPHEVAVAEAEPVVLDAVAFELAGPPTPAPRGKCPPSTKMPAPPAPPKELA